MRRSCLTALLSLIAACSSAADRAGNIALGEDGAVLPVIDTVDGVLVMRHSAEAFESAPVWALDSVPQVVIDGGDGFDLSYADSPVFLADGRAVVLKSVGGGELMLFDRAGRPSRLLARSGHGPGELWAPAGVALLAGDTLVVADEANSAINWYTADSGVVRTARLEASWPSSCYQTTGQLADLRQVAIGYCTSNVMSPDYRTLVGTTPVVLYSLDRSRFDTVRVIPGIEMRMIEMKQGDRSFTVPRGVEMGRFPTVTAVDSTIVLAGGVGGYVLDLLSAGGEANGRIVIDVPMRLVTDSLKQAAIAKRLAQIDETPHESGANLERIRDNVRNAPYADTLPPYGRVMAGADGMFWVLDQQFPNNGHWSATAFRLDGSIVARLEGGGVDGGPVAFHDGRVMIRQVDADGVVRFAMYRVVKSDQ